MIQIDGAILEGGGSILRLASAFSVVTGKTVEITNIRKKRSRPGLAAQHLTGLKVISAVFGAGLQGDHMRSESVRIIPNQKEAVDKHSIDIRTAGSVVLAFQPVLIAALTSNRRISLNIRGGGTYGMAAPPVDYLDNVYRSLMEKMGFIFKVKVKKHGFFPKGGGLVDLDLYPMKFDHLKQMELLEQERIQKITGISVASNQLSRANVGERQAESAARYLKKRLPKDIDIDIKVNYSETSCTGSGITLWAENALGSSTMGASDFGTRGKRSETVGRNAARDLMATLHSRAAVDSYLGDQIIPYMALAANRNNETSMVTVPKITNHMLTNMEVCRIFFPRLQISSNARENHHVIIVKQKVE
ncbi:MAG: RNA 3'-terminal phosphate cyclase [Candidatus Hodarchaeales archaeon]